MPYRILSVLFLLVSFVLPATGNAEPVLKKMGSLPEFISENDQGQKVSQATFKNKFLVINFFFTKCEGPCPVLMTNVRKLADEFDSPELNFLSFTVDPENDNGEKLLEYRKNVGLEDLRINLLRSSTEEVLRLLNQGFKLGSGDKPVDHSTRFVLVDKSGIIRALVSGSSLDEIRSLVKQMLNE